MVAMRPCDDQNIKRIKRRISLSTKNRTSKISAAATYVNTFAFCNSFTGVQLLSTT